MDNSDALHRPLYCADILINALNQDPNRPLLHLLDGPVMRKAEHDVNDMRRLASCGRPVPWVHVELLDSNNCPVTEGEPGEICVRGPLVMDGYRDNPELTAQTFAGGWHHTGDVAVRDPDGFLRIIDRRRQAGQKSAAREIRQTCLNGPFGTRRP
jgi:acyl-CoA synthetase (AMP-forming)/AMP-acid ligase II